MCLVARCQHAVYHLQCRHTCMHNGGRCMRQMRGGWVGWRLQYRLEEEGILPTFHMMDWVLLPFAACSHRSMLHLLSRDEKLDCLKKKQGHKWLLEKVLRLASATFERFLSFCITPLWHSPNRIGRFQTPKCFPQAANPNAEFQNKLSKFYRKA